MLLISLWFSTSSNHSFITQVILVYKRKWRLFVIQISKFEDSHKYFTIPGGAVRFSRSRGSSTSRSAFVKIFEANHPHHGRQVSTSSLPVPRYNALMSIIKLTDPRYCSPLDSPNTHLSSSKGRRVLEVLALSGTLRQSLGELTGPRE